MSLRALLCNLEYVAPNQLANLSGQGLEGIVVQSALQRPGAHELGSLCPTPCVSVHAAEVDFTAAHDIVTPVQQTSY